MKRASRKGFIVAAALALVACRTRPTQITLFVESNVDAQRTPSLTLVARAGSATYDALVGDRAQLESTMPAAVRVPGSIALVPRAGARRSGAITLLATLRVAATATQPAFVIERMQRVTLIEGVPQQARLFFDAQCSDRAIGCTTVPAAQCTVSTRCIEQQATCGDQGLCVSAELPTTIVPPDISLDAMISVDAAAPPLDVSTGRIDELACGAEQADPATARAIATRVGHTCAVRAGLLHCWGKGALGAIGDGANVDRATATLVGTTAPRWLSVATAEGATCAVDSSRGVWCWGNNDNGQLGLGDTMNRARPTIVSGLCDVRVIVGGYAHFCAITGAGRLLCWGDNAEGQLGQNDRVGSGDRSAPVEVMPSGGWAEVAPSQGHTCATRTNGELYCWGRNSEGQLGLGGAARQQIRTPTRVGTLADWRALSAGQDATCATRASGELHCWGPPNEFLSATMSVMPALYMDSTSTRAAQVETFTLFVLGQDGALRSVGRNVEGQLGLGNNTTATTLSAVSVATSVRLLAIGRFHSCLMGDDDSLWCAGENAEGQLGLGDRNRRSSFTRLP